MREAAIERAPFYLAVRRHDQRAAGSLVTSARLHADVAVLDQIHATHAVFAADGVQLFKQFDRLHFFAIDGNGASRDETNGDVFGLARRGFRAPREHPDLFGRGIFRVFERAAFVRDVPDVAIAAVNLFGGLRNGYFVGSGIGDVVFVRYEVPIPPGR